MDINHLPTLEDFAQVFKKKQLTPTPGVTLYEREACPIGAWQGEFDSTSTVVFPFESGVACGFDGCIYNNDFYPEEDSQLFSLGFRVGRACRYELAVELEDCV